MASEKKFFGLTALIFLPAFVLTCSIIFFGFWQYGVGIDDSAGILAVEDYETWKISEFVTEKEWLTLSMKEIDEKLIANNQPTIGDLKNIFYETPNQEVFYYFYRYKERKETHNFQIQPIPKDYFETSLENLQSAYKLVFYFFLILFGIFVIIAGFILTFLSKLLAKRAVKPMTIALKKQKEFIGFVSHELRTPLTLIHSDIEILKHKKPMDVATVSDFSKKTQTEILRLNTLITKLLQLAQIIEIKAIKKDKKSIEADWERLRTKFMKRSRSENKKFVMESLETDIKIIHPVIGLENLVSVFLENAFKYSQELAEITVNLKINKKNIEINIKNSGSGILPKNLPYIFDRFYRGENVQESDGFGLGLALAKESIVSAGGKVTVASVPNENTNFTITLAR